MSNVYCAKQVQRRWIMDLQQKLARALEQRKIDDFKEALDLGANPNELDENKRSIYETSLANRGCAEFIKLCLEYKCSVNYVNQQLKKAAINYAADSRDSENLKVLLEQPERVQVNHKYNDFTPLNLLARNLNNENVTEITKCISLLLYYGADPNIPDNNEMTPLYYVVVRPGIESSQRKELIKLFLQQPELDIDSLNDGELRKRLEKLMTNSELPAKRQSSESTTEVRNQLLNALVNDNDDRFQQLLGSYQGELSEFVEKCITTGRHRVLDRLLLTDIDINAKPEGYEMTFVEIAATYGNWESLEKLLQDERLKLPRNLELLEKVIGRLDERPVATFSSYVKCFKVLLKSSHVNVNETDSSGRSPLHYATLYNSADAVLELLRHGAYLGIKSKFQEIAIQDIDPEVLEQHFDDCITVSGPSRASLHSQLEPIIAIGQSKKLRHLLNHPLISSFICLKWGRLSSVFYCNLIISILFSSFVVTNILLTFSDRINGNLLSIFKVLSWAGIIYFVVYELIKCFVSGVVCTIGQVYNVAHILMLIANNSLMHPEIYYSRALAAFTILLLAVRQTYMLGSVPIWSISIRVMMLKKVFTTFMKSCIPYSILIISFGLSFNILNFHKLSKKSILEAILKTIVMATGEFDESDLNYQVNVVGPLILVVFVVLISIVLMNLLTALAFSDTQAIQSLAEVNSLICQADLLSSYEVFLTHPWRCLEFLRSFVHRSLKIKNTILFETVSTFPNRQNNSTVSSDNGVEMQPLNTCRNIQQHEINIPQYQPVEKLSNEMIKRILQMIDRK